MALTIEVDITAREIAGMGMLRDLGMIKRVDMIDMILGELRTVDMIDRRMMIISLAEEAISEEGEEVGDEAISAEDEVIMAEVDLAEVFF